MSFGKKLKELRFKRNITQQKLADDLQVTQSIIARYELDKTKPSTEALLAISTYFNVSLDFLLGDINLTEEDIAEGYTEESAFDDLIERIVKLKIKTEQEQEVLALYNRLSTDGKKFILHLLRTYKDK